MRFLARFASARDLECFRIDELRAVCSVLGISNWSIEGISSAGDAADTIAKKKEEGQIVASSSSTAAAAPSPSSTGDASDASPLPPIGDAADGDPDLLIDALILDQTAAAETAARVAQLKIEQPLGNHKNFYTSSSSLAVKSSLPTKGSGESGDEKRQPVNFAIVRFDTIADAVAVAQRCVLLKGFNLLLATAVDVDGLLEKVSARAAAEGAEGAVAAAGASDARNRFFNPLEKDAATGGQPLSADPSRAVEVLTRGGDADADDEAGGALLTSLLDVRYSFKYHVDAVCYALGGPEKLAIIQRFAAIPHAGVVCLSDPHLVFEVTLLYKYTHVNPKKEKVVPPVLGAAFSVPVAISGRTYILDRYALNRRPYIGTTSMPPELTFAMANMAKVQSGDLCYDPFCGTCSSLITCAHHGAVVYGSDIDGQAMRGGSTKFRASRQVIQQQQHAMKGYLPQCLVANGGSVTPEEAASPSVLTNFKVLGLAPPERLRYDFSLWVTLFDQLDGAYTGTGGTAAAACTGAEADAAAAGASSGAVVGAKRPRDASRPFLFDAILSDPPYGIREQKQQTTGEEVEVRPARQKKLAAAAEAAAAAASSSADDDTAVTASGPIATSSSLSAAADVTAAAAAPATMRREDYDISTMIVDLIRFAGVHLRVGGRIVFWHPTTYHYTPDELPRHPYLKIVLARPQMLSLKLVRVLVVMERTAAPWFPLPAGVSGPADVTKAVLFPHQRTASLRLLMDATELDDNKAYDDYKNRRDAKREAVRAFWRQQNAEAEASGAPAPAVVVPPHKAAAEAAGISKRQLSKQKALVNLENREKKLAPSN